MCVCVCVCVCVMCVMSLFYACLITHICVPWGGGAHICHEGGGAGRMSHVPHTQTHMCAMTYSRVRFRMCDMVHFYVCFHVGDMPRVGVRQDLFVFECRDSFIRVT